MTLTPAKYYFFFRGGKHPGITVSKHAILPPDDFRITEYIFREWGYEALWFVDADKFTKAERQAAFRQPRVLSNPTENVT